jgi:hypothetical protein
MRSKSDEPHRGGGPVLVDQHETELNLAVAMIVPDARELVVSADFRREPP